jgi:hypothetical protein
MELATTAQDRRRCLTFIVEVKLAHRRKLVGLFHVTNIVTQEPRNETTARRDGLLGVPWDASGSDYMT